ncbi:MAG TPA: rhomboid family intramembrane serine protease [Planctomycetota bacterium]|nr:rhomboid family intramembrane serine protease [Planctomycetota bacterium]
MDEPDHEPPEPAPPRTTRARRHRASAAAFVTRLAEGMPTPWVTWSIVAINVVVYAAMVAAGASPMSPSIEQLMTWGADFGPATMDGEWWRLVTNTFVHIGAVHLALNLWCLWGAGCLVERLVGHGTFLTLYVFAAVVGSLTSIAWAPEIVSAGASGAVFGTFGALYACSRALRRTVPDGLFEDLRLRVALFVGYNILYGLRNPAIDQAAHAGGLVAGFVGAALLCRARTGETARVPPLGVDRRLVPALVAVLALGVGLASWRVGSSDIGRLQALWEQKEHAVAAQRFDEALVHVDEMIAIDPDDGRWHGDRGWYLGMLGRTEEALRATERALASDDSDAVLHNNRAWLLGLLGRHDEAVRSAEQALTIDPKLLLAHHNLMVSLDALRRDEDYVRAAKAAVAVDENDVASLVHLCWAQRKLGHLTEALAAAEAALAIEPQHELAAQHRDWLRAQLGRSK